VTLADFLIFLKDVDEEADSEVPDDEEINKLIARSEKEFEIFQEMDIEREEQALADWESAGNKGPPPPRLMTEEELPEHLQIDIGVEVGSIEIVPKLTKNRWRRKIVA
jgi:hypothetical protein